MMQASHLFLNFKQLFDCLRAFPFTLQKVTQVKQITELVHKVVQLSGKPSLCDS